MRKLRPSNYWNIGKIESWFSDMAAEGYFLQTMDKNFCEFEKAEPQYTSYRIEIALDGKDLSREQHQKYNRDIWTNVTNFKKFYVFSCPYNFINQEVNPFPEELAESLKPIYRKTLLSILGIIVGALILIKLFPHILNEKLIIETLNGTSFDIITILLLLYSIISLFQEGFFQRKLIKSLSKGIPIDHGTPWRRTYWFSYILWGIKNLLIIGIIISPLMFIYSSNSPLSAEDIDLPIVRLEAIETADGSDFDKSLLLDGNYTKRWSVLSPNQYNSQEYLGNDPYKVTWLETSTYKLLMPSMNKIIVDALAFQYDKYYDDTNNTLTPLQSTSNNDFDILEVRERGTSKQIFAAKDEWVIRLIYMGDKTVEDIIDAISDMFNTKVKST